MSGALQGIYPHRNLLGFVLAVGIPAALSVRVRTRGGWLVPVVSTAILVMGIAATQSTTAVVASLAVVLVALAYLLTNRLVALRRWALLLSLGVSATVIGTIAVLNYGSIAIALGRDPSLTGRTSIWDAAWETIAARPLLGHGLQPLWSNLGYHPHNGYLNIFYTVGIIGAIVFVVFLAGALALATRFAWTFPPRRELLWPLLTIVLVLVYDVSETMSTRPLGWFLLVLALCVAAAGLQNHSTRMASVKPWKRSVTMASTR